MPAQHAESVRHVAGHDPLDVAFDSHIPESMVNPAPEQSTSRMNLAVVGAFELAIEAPTGV